MQRALFGICPAGNMFLLRLLTRGLATNRSSILPPWTGTQQPELLGGELTPQWLSKQLQAAGVAEGAALALAISGGSDSMALAVLAAGLPGPSPTALVVDHALRPESAAEARRVAEWLARLGLPNAVLTLDWPHGRPAAGRVQEAAREARYSALASECHRRDLSALLTGHQWDDQAELLLIRLSRASGISGLAGMEVSSRQVFAGHPLHLVRPLLGANKAQLKQVCVSAGQSWVEDPSNATPVYLRNRVRAVLQDPTAGLSAADVAATLSLCGYLKGTLQERTAEVLNGATCSKEDGRHVLDLAALAAAPPVVQGSVLQEIVHAVGPPRGGRPVKSRALDSLLAYLAKGCKKAALFDIGRTQVHAEPGGREVGRITFSRRVKDGRKLGEWT